MSSSFVCLLIIMNQRSPIINVEKDSPPPPYSRFGNDDRVTPLYSSPVIDPYDCTDSQLSCEETSTTMPPLHMSTETGGTLQFGFHSHLPGKSSDINSNSTQQRQEWCKLAYWEKHNRVGKLFRVNTTSVNVFSHKNLLHGDGFCINEIVKSSMPNKGSLSNSPQEECVRRTREKIGFGVTIRREKTGVFVSNKCKYPIFINSPTLDPPNSRNLTVFKVLPENTIKVFDYVIARRHKSVQKSQPPDGPFDPNAFRISFAKGWGPGYSRQFITSCPCWLEVLLTVPR